MCFIGHGAWGIITKPGWLPFFKIFFISPDLAFQLMPIVGTIDILLGLIILIYPMRAVLLYMIFWCIFTALLRPSAGMGWWEFFERAGNYGAPLILLLCSGYPGNWFAKIIPTDFNKTAADKIYLYLKILIGLLLIGHGGYGAFQHKTMLIEHFKSAHLIPTEIDPAVFIATVGYLEILMGILIILLRRPPFFFILLIICWKIGTEFLYVIHAPTSWDYWEFIERAGSYGLPITLLLLCPIIQTNNTQKLKA